MSIRPSKKGRRFFERAWDLLSEEERKKLDENIIEDILKSKHLYKQVFYQFQRQDMYDSSEIFEKYKKEIFE